MFKCIFQLHLAADSTVAGAGWVRSSVHCGERTRVERDRCGSSSSSSSKIDSLRVSRSGLEREMKHRNHMKGDVCWQHEDTQQWCGAPLLFVLFFKVKLTLYRPRRHIGRVERCNLHLFLSPARWRWVISFTSRPFYLRQKCPQFLLNRMLETKN